MNTPPETIELYDFRSASAAFGLTPHEFDVDLEGQVYASVPLGRSALALGPEAAKAALQLRLPPDHALVGHLLASALSGEVMSLTLRLARRASAGHWEVAGVRWLGRVLGAEVADELAQIACESAQISLKRSGLRRLYSRQCSHVLYSAACGAALRQHSATVLQASGRRVDLAGAVPAHVAGGLAGGWLQTPTGARHMIVSEVGSALELMAPIALAPDTVVQLVCGCDHSTATCASRFGNLDNYGGFPSIPSKNPFSTGVF